MSLKLWIGIAVLLTLFLIPILVCSAAEQPRRGGTLVVPVNADPTTLNPAVTIDINVHRVMWEVFEGLVELDRDLNPLPGLADSWDVSVDGMTITFHLAKNVKWHDGKPFTSKDVEFSVMEVVGKYHPQNMWIKDYLKSIETPNDHTAVFLMKKAYAPLFLGLIEKNCPIIPRHLYEGTDILKNPHNLSNPIGTGPFKFKEWMKGDQVTLIRNENYRKPGLPYLDRIIFRVIKDPGTRSLAFEKGEIDLLDFITGSYPDFKRLSSLPNVITSPPFGDPGLSVIALNLKGNKILSNLKVRQAIYHAIDRQFISDKARYGLNPPADSAIPKLFRDFYNPNVKKYDYNLGKANKLLDEAGYQRGTDGVRFKIRLTYELGFTYAEKPSQIIKPMLREAGIDVALEVLERSVLFEKVFAKYDYDMFVFGQSPNGDPAIGLSRYYTTSSIKPIPFVNVVRYSNPEVDRLFDEAASAVDRKKRAKAYWRVQEILAEELPYIWLFEFAHDTNLVKSKFKNCFRRVFSSQYVEVWWTGEN